MSMKAVVFRGPFDVGVETRPKPQIRDAADAIIRVKLAGICGSELHMYRGVQKTAAGHIMGHEFIGVIEQIGSDVHKFTVGDEVVSLFSPVCLRCWYCKQGLTNRCIEGVAFGTQKLDGGQAEFVRVPFADGTLHPVPPELDESLLIMMCDIFPTGYYGASRAVEGLLNQHQSPLTSFRNTRATKVSLKGQNGQTNGFTNGQKNDTTSGDAHFDPLGSSVVVCIGCGPVGICAITTALSKGIKTVLAVDSVEDRLAEAAQVGAIPLNLSRHNILDEVMSRTQGRGADAVIEVVGNPAALKSAFELLRPCGILSSVGFHQDELPFTGLECYLKNITMNFGRVPVGTVFLDALECLKENQEALKNYVTHELSLDDAAVGFDIFEKRVARKVVLRV
ncbi:GroES-like protein [Trichoderma austrokoningii]